MNSTVTLKPRYLRVTAHLTQKGEKLAADFYSNLKRVKEIVRFHNFLVISSDFIGQIIQTINMRFMKHPQRLWTFQHPSITTYILVRNKSRNSVRKDQAYLSLSSVGPHHRVVSIHVALSPRSSIPPVPVEQVDWAKVSSKITLRYSFVVDV